MVCTCPGAEACLQAGVAMQSRAVHVCCCSWLPLDLSVWPALTEARARELSVPGFLTVTGSMFRAWQY